MPGTSNNLTGQYIADPMLLIEKFYHERYPSDDQENKNYHSEENGNFSRILASSKPENLSIGLQYEILFYLAFSLMSNDAILIATYTQDHQGYDFIVNGVPIDVTINDSQKNIISSFCCSTNSATFILPISKESIPMLINHSNNAYIHPDKNYFNQYLKHNFNPIEFLKKAYNMSMAYYTTLLRLNRYLNNESVNLTEQDRNVINSLSLGNKLLIKQTMSSTLNNKILMIDSAFSCFPPNWNKKQ